MLPGIEHQAHQRRLDFGDRAPGPAAAPGTFHQKCRYRCIELHVRWERPRTRDKAAELASGPAPSPRRNAGAALGCRGPWGVDWIAASPSMERIQNAGTTVAEVLLYSALMKWFIPTPSNLSAFLAS